MGWGNEDSLCSIDACILFYGLLSRRPTVGCNHPRLDSTSIAVYVALFLPSEAIFLTYDDVASQLADTHYIVRLFLQCFFIYIYIPIVRQHGWDSSSSLACALFLFSSVQVLQSRCGDKHVTSVSPKRDGSPITGDHSK